MPINGMIIKSGATCSVTGGTDLTLVADGQEIPNGIHVVDTTTADFRLRGNATFKNRAAAYTASNNSWSKEKKTVTYVQPKLLATGEIVFNLVRVEREIHPESTAAEASELNQKGAQLFFDGDFTNFWSYGSLA